MEEKKEKGRLVEKAGELDEAEGLEQNGVDRGAGRHSWSLISSDALVTREGLASTSGEVESKLRTNAVDRAFLKRGESLYCWRTLVKYEP